MPKVKQDKSEEIIDSVQLAAKAFFKNNKDIIYNQICEPYKVSTGVYQIDAYLNGGIDSGTLVRLLGESTSGKSSEGLLIIKNFLESRKAAGKKARGVIFPTEARLTEKLKGRSGVPFVDDPADWVEGTMLIIPSNIYDAIANFIGSLVKTNAMKKIEDRENFIFFIDCLDYCILKDDAEKEIGVARKVAGPQYLTKMFWSAFALPFAQDQHIFLATSQQSAAPQLDKYSKAPVRQGGSSGGNSARFQASTVLEFSQRFESHYLLQNDSLDYCPQKNKKVGHEVNGWIRKSNEEVYDQKFSYKVCYHRTGGNSVWREFDIADWLVSFELLYREGAKGAWFTLRDTIYNELKLIDDTIPEKFQGLNNFKSYLESNVKVTDYLYNKMLNSLVAPPKPEDGMDPLAED